jgi:hypothetical protein
VTVSRGRQGRKWWGRREEGGVSEGGGRGGREGAVELGGKNLDVLHSLILKQKVSLSARPKFSPSFDQTNSEQWPHPTKLEPSSYQARALFLPS